MKKDNLKVFRQLIEPAMLGYLIMAAAGLLLYFFLMSGRGGDITALIAIFFAIPGILIRWTASPIIVLLLTFYGLFDPGFSSFLNFLGSGRWLSNTSGNGFSFEDLLLSVAVLSYLIGHYRLNAMLNQVLPNEPSVRRDTATYGPIPRPSSQVKSEEMPRVLILAGVCIIGTQIAWLLVTTIERFKQPHLFNIGTGRLMVVVWGFGSFLMILSAVMTYLRMNAMTPTEASMVLRDEAFHEIRRETDRIERWRQWFKTKMSRSRVGR